MTKKLIVKISADGKVIAETEGMKGPSCENYVKLLEKIVQGKTIKLERKPEYFMEEEVEMQESIERKLVVEDK